MPQERTFSPIRESPLICSMLPASGAAMWSSMYGRSSRPSPAPRLLRGVGSLIGSPARSRPRPAVPRHATVTRAIPGLLAPPTHAALSVVRSPALGSCSALVVGTAVSSLRANRAQNAVMAHAPRAATQGGPTVRLAWRQSPASRLTATNHRCQQSRQGKHEGGPGQPRNDLSGSRRAPAGRGHRNGREDHAQHQDPSQERRHRHIPVGRPRQPRVACHGLGQPRERPAPPCPPRGGLATRSQAAVSELLLDQGQDLPAVEPHAAGVADQSRRRLSQGRPRRGSAQDRDSATPSHLHLTQHATEGLVEQPSALLAGVR